MCSRESLLSAWIDPWMCSLVVDVEDPRCEGPWTGSRVPLLSISPPRCVLGPLDVFQGILA
jgi:hypothetical protein